MGAFPIENLSIDPKNQSEAAFLIQLKNMLPCQFTHQNVEGAIYCSECNPNGPDFD